MSHIKILNVETGEVIEREMTEEELAQKIKDDATQQAFMQAQAEAATKRQALLDKLGITEDDAKLLLA